MASKLVAATEALAEFPEPGRRHPRGWREFAGVKPSLIQCNVSDALVRVLRIRHAARRPR